MKNDLKDFDIAFLMEHPIQALENLYELKEAGNLTEGGSKRLRNLILRSILQISGHSKPETDNIDECIEIEAKGILDHYLEIVDKRLVACTLTRLMSEMEDFRESAWRPKIMTFLDSQFQNEYKEWKIDSTAQTHERMYKLIDIYKDQEKTFYICAKAAPNPDRLSQTRQKIMSTLNSRTGRVLTRPFLPDNVESQIGSFFDSIERYFEYKDSLQVIEYYERVEQIANEFTMSLTSLGSHFCLALVNGIVNQLLTLVYQDFSNNKVAQPALLAVEPRNKKYPLHLEGQEIKVGINLRNSGPGYSYETRVVVVGDDNDIEFGFPEINVGRLLPNENQLVEFPARVIHRREQSSIIVQVLWRNYTGKEQVIDSDIVIKAQRSDLDWQALKQKDPYSLEPVSNEKELIGRQDVLNKLLASLKNENIGSSIVHGQKRVGKTSIGKALESHLEDLGYISIYLEAGDYVEPKARRTISRLGTKLCNKLIDAEPRIKHITIPSFEDAFSPLTDFLDEVEKITPDRKIIFLLDEFDELPLELYIRGEIGDSFFLTLRSISNRKNIGFILIGGEKMSHIMDFQGDNLNKWGFVSVDYFTREQDWADYIELVQRPVLNILEFSGEALGYLHDLTAGNPYFTKLICRHIFQAAVNMRDCYITPKEIELVLETALRETGKNTFQHFWEDGIFETERATEKSIRRRKILIALSDLQVKQTPVSGRRINEHPLVKNEATLESDLREFVSRKVLKGKINGAFSDHSYEFFVRFFYEWLRSHGIQDVISTFADLDASLRQRQKEENLRVRSSELVDLVSKWGAYRGRTLTEDKLRAWLEQFSNIEEQRIMFKLLTNLRFYTNSLMRFQMKEAHEIVIRGLAIIKQYRQQRRPDIVVSYLDGPGKSGSTFAKLYIDENKLLSDNVVEVSRLAETLQKKNEISAVVFLDDFVGTGTQATENIEKINKEIGEIILAKKIRLIFVAIVACNQGWKKVEEYIDVNDMPMEFHCCELLRDEDFLFSSESKVFPDDVERDTALEIANRYGKSLVKDNPIGFGSIGLAIAFEHRCPNDTLPILWAEGNNPKWIPLFKRL